MCGISFSPVFKCSSLLSANELDPKNPYWEIICRLTVYKIRQITSEIHFKPAVYHQTFYEFHWAAIIRSSGDLYTLRFLWLCILRPNSRSRKKSLSPQSSTGTGLLC